MQVDHVEIFVPSREQAARWYERALGFRTLEEHRDWAVAGGPLMIGRRDCNFMIALFRGQPQGDTEVRGLRRLAFRVDATGFAGFLAGSSSWRSEALGPDQIQDHGKALSVYFTDPWGNPLEVTTYEYEAAREGLTSPDLR